MQRCDCLQSTEVRYAPHYQWHTLACSVRITWKPEYAGPPHLFSLSHRAHAVAKNLGAEYRGPPHLFSVIRLLLARELWNQVIKAIFQQLLTQHYASSASIFTQAKQRCILFPGNATFHNLQRTVDFLHHNIVCCIAEHHTALCTSCALLENSLRLHSEVHLCWLQVCTEKLGNPWPWYENCRAVRL